MEKGRNLLINDVSDVGQARRVASSLALDLDFDTSEIAKLALIVTEACGNIIKYAKQGELLFQARKLANKAEIEMFFLDKGPGIQDVPHCLMDGYSTSGTLGVGLGAIQRLASSFEIYSVPRIGTVMWVKFEKNNLAPPLLIKEEINLPCPVDFTSIVMPLTGEDVSGDAWATSILNPHTQLFMLVDGLGHGPEAHKAALEAVSVFHEYAGSTLSEILSAQHKALRKTRGAAAAIAKIDLNKQEITYAGIGNIAGVVLLQAKRRGMLSLNGIVGHQMGNVHEAVYPFDKEAVLVMHSDGLISHWDETSYARLFQKTPGIIGGTLYRDYNRGRDDISILVVKNKMPSGTA